MKQIAGPFLHLVLAVCLSLACISHGMPLPAGGSETTMATSSSSSGSIVAGASHSHFSHPAFTVKLAPDKITQQRRSEYIDAIQRHIIESYPVTSKQYVGKNLLGQKKYKDVAVDAIDFGARDEMWETAHKDWEVEMIKFNCAQELYRTGQDPYRTPSLLEQYGNAHLSLALLSHDKRHHYYATLHLLKQHDKWLANQS